MYLNKILLTTDFSEGSKSAFGLAIHAAKQSKSDLTLINVVERPIVPIGFDGYIPPTDFIENIEKEQLESANLKLKELVSDYFTNLPVKTVALQSFENPATSICKYAAENNFGLIVTANQGRGATGRILFGSTTERMTRLSKKPVLIAHAPKGSDRQASGATGIFKHILVTTDFSTDSELAFKYAAYEAKQNEAKVTLLHVVQNLLAPELLAIKVKDNFDAEGIQKNYMKSLAEKLKQYAKDHFPISNIETKLIEKGNSASSTIVDFSNQNGCDLVVISTHGANKAFQLIGGVAERVLRGMHCPVLLIPKES